MAYASADEAHVPGSFLGALFGHLEDGVVAISQPRDATGDKGGLVTDYLGLEALGLYEPPQPRSTWVGAATRHRPLPSYERGGKEECLHVPAFWADVDVYDPEAHAEKALPKTLEAAQYVLAQFPLAPSIVVDSGHGLQAWWLLGEAMAATTYEEHWRRRWSWAWREAVDRLNAQIARAGGQPISRLDSVWSVDRIMRVPGTLNTKVPEAPVPCRLLELHPGRRYGLDELEEALPEPPDERPGIWQPQASIRAVGAVLAGDDYNARHTAQEVFQRAGWEGDERGRMWTRPGKDARQGHSAEVFPDGFARVYSSTVHRDYPAMADATGEPVNLSPFALDAVLHYPAEDLVGATTAYAEDLEALGYGTPAAERGQAVQDAIRALLPAPRERGHLQLVPAERTDATGAEVAPAPDEAPTRSSWRRINLLDIRREPDDKRPKPTILAIEGLAEVGIFYPTKLHMVVGESESGKSWLALVAARSVLRDGGQVLFVDFEDDERSVEERLSALQVTDDELGRFVYIRPDGPLFTIGRNGAPAVTADMAEFRAELEQMGAAELIIFDGINECLGVHGLSMNQATEVAVLYNVVLRPLAKVLGAAVVGIDHVGKDKEAKLRGDAIGSQHKRAACDVMLTMYKVRPFARGKDGMAKVRVSKDRPGMLRQACEDPDARELAEFRLSSSAVETAAALAKAVPLDPVDLTNPHLDHVHAWVLAHPGCSGREVEANIPGRAADIRGALGTLEQLGRIVRRARQAKGGGFGYWESDEDRDDMGNRVPPHSPGWASELPGRDALGTHLQRSDQEES